MIRRKTYRQLGRREFGDLLRGAGRRQPTDHLGQVDLRIEVVHGAVGQEGIDQRGARTRLGVSDKQIVLQSQLGRAKHVLDEIVVDLESALLKVDDKLAPLPDGIADRLSQFALRQMSGLFSLDFSPQFIGQGAAVRLAHQATTLGRRFGVAQPALDSVKLSDVLKDRHHDLRDLLARLVKLPSDMGQAAAQPDPAKTVGQGLISAVAVALDDPREGGRAIRLIEAE